MVLLGLASVAVAHAVAEVGGEELERDRLAGASPWAMNRANREAKRMAAGRGAWVGDAAGVLWGGCL